MPDPTNIEWETVRPAGSTTARDGVDVVVEALDRCGQVEEFLDRAFTAGESVLLVVNDGHRSTRTRDALVALERVIDRRPRDIRFRALIATGTHRFDDIERGEFEHSTFDACGLGIDDVAWHDASDAGALIDIGGVAVHPWIAASVFLMPIGSVEPHYFAGVTGAHKTLTIGCMSRLDIERNHSHAMSPDSEILRLEGNPVYGGIVRTLKLIEQPGKCILAINEVLANGVLVCAEAGGVFDTLKTLMPAVQEIYLRQITKAVDVLRLRVPPPLDRSLYQADKALKNNHLAVRDGGGILLEAQCREGLGLDAFMNLLRRAATYADAVEQVRDQGYRLGDHKAVKLRHLTDSSCRGVHVALMSSHVLATDAESAGLRAFAPEDSSSALEWLLGSISGAARRGLIIEDAGCAVVKVKPPSC